MSKSILLTVLFGAVLMLASCSQEGIGGKSTIAGYVNHHGEPIPNAKVFIKYGSEELPGTRATDFDDETLATAADGYFEFQELQKGAYYLYAIGYDQTIFDSVFGGIPIVLEKGDEREIEIPVTE